MPSAPVTADGERPRVGRPARINRQMIAEAAHDLGLEGLTLRAVADHLGVSIAALYHHVSSKDDLMRAAAEYSASRVPLPQDRGQHWAVWLLEWATYSRDAFLAHSGLLSQYLEGAVPAASISESMDTILGHLVHQGFGIRDADAAYELVVSCALGSALNTIREQEAEASGHSLRSLHEEVLATHADDELPHLRQLLAELRDQRRRSFHQQLTTVIRGIAGDLGLEWAPIASALDEARRAPGRPPRRAGSPRRA